MFTSQNKRGESLARQFPWTTRERKAALLEAINAVGDLHCLNYILLDQYHTGTFSLDLRKCCVNIGDNDRRQPETDLVAEKDAGIGHQRPSNRSHLLLPARQNRCAGGSPVPQSRKQRIDAIEGPRTCQFAAIAADHQVLFDGKGVKQPPSLGHEGNTALDDVGRGFCADRLAIEQDTVGGPPHEAGNCLQERRLACPVCADDGDGLAFVQSRIDAVQRLEVAIERRELAGFQKRHPSRLDADIDLVHLG